MSLNIGWVVEVPEFLANTHVGGELGGERYDAFTHRLLYSEIIT